MNHRQTPSGTVRFAELSPQERRLIRLCQNINFGSICDIEVREGEPVLDRPPVVMIDLKLDADDAPRNELSLTDFELRREITQLFMVLRRLGTGIVQRIDVQAGIPRRAMLRGLGIQYGPQHQTESERGETAPEGGKRERR
jgi:hypothetical protein